MTREEKARQCGQAANAQFFSEAREAVVSFGRPGLDDSVVAYVKLHFRDSISSEEPSTELYLRLIRTAFLELLDAGTIQEKHPLTSLGWNYIDEIRRATGVGVENLPPPATPQLSADDKLRQEIINDWHTLPGDKVRAKAAADKNYFRILNELLEGDGIPAPGSTSFYQITGPDFGSQNRY
jgi:hypothetical protein